MKMNQSPATWTWLIVILDTKPIKSRSYQVTASFSTTADLSWSCGSSRERGSHKGPHGPGLQGFQSPPLPDSARSGPQLPPLRSGTRERWSWSTAFLCFLESCVTIAVRRGGEAIIVSVVLCNVLLCIDRGCGYLLTILNAYDFSINETVINFTFGFYMGL